MKTFFITLSAGQEIRNLLYGDFLEIARQDPDVRLVCFVPADKFEEIKKEFNFGNCIIEQIPELSADSKLKEWFRTACFGCVPTRTIWSRIWFSYLAGGSTPNFLMKYFFWILGHLRVWRAGMRFVEYHIFRDDRIWKDFFDTYKPEVVFGPAIIFEPDVTLLKCAKRRGIRTVGMMRGWDNFTSKGFLRCPPDLLLVQNRTMREEAYHLNSFPREKTRVVGFPQWDHYGDSSWFMSKEELAGIFGVDPNKPWVVYFGGGLMADLFNLPERGDHLLMIRDAIKRNELPDVQLLIRPHPGLAHKDNLRADAKMVGPVLLFASGWKFTTHEMKLLMNLIRVSDVILNMGSTIALEAAIFDTPAILVAFNGYETDAELPWHKRLSVAMDNTKHYHEDVEGTGGVWRVNNEQELIAAVKGYLENPALHHEGRTRLVTKLVGPTDGQAGKRIFDALKEL